eukprot:s2127_g10.t1
MASGGERTREEAIPSGVRLQQASFRPWTQASKIELLRPILKDQSCRLNVRHLALSTLGPGRMVNPRRTRWHSARRQSAEIEALQAIYAEDGEFELLQEPEEGEAAGASFRVRCPNFLGEVRVNLPATYPAQGRPTFVLERLRGPAAEAVQLGLEELANEHAAEECIFDVLSRAVEVAESAGLALPDEAEAAPSQE